MRKLQLLLIILMGINIANSVQAQENWDEYDNSQYLGNSLNGVQIVDEPWNRDNTFLWSDTESFLMIELISNKHIMAVSVDESGNDPIFYFYDIDPKGEIINRHEIPEATYGIDTRFNLVEKKDKVYYFNTSWKGKVFVYKPKKGTHEDADYEEMDWGKIENWREHYRYKSPDDNYTITLSDTDLILTDHKSNQSDTLIQHEYMGDWSFGRGCWNESSTKFYFDNKGAVACIWEIDLVRRTLNKIVPEHEASDPVVAEDGGVFYCEEGSIKVAKPE